MPCLWLINQFANTPICLHTRQFEVAAGLVSDGWQVEVFASDFNSPNANTDICFPRLWSTERPAGIRWTWLWVSSYNRNNWKRQLNMLSFCLHLAVRLGPVAIIGRLVGRAPDVILRAHPSSQLLHLLLDRSPGGIPLCLSTRPLASGVDRSRGEKSS